jgi:hypothetical protein
MAGKFPIFPLHWSPGYIFPRSDELASAHLLWLGLAALRNDVENQVADFQNVENYNYNVDFIRPNPDSHPWVWSPPQVLGDKQVVLVR